MRWLKAIGGIFAAVVLLLLGVIAETHWEMSGLHSELPAVAALEALRKQPGGPSRVRFINMSSQSGGGPARLGHNSIVLEWEDGRAFLIDAGMRRETAIEFSKLGELVFGSDVAEVYDSVPDQLGAAVDSVEGIAFTHLHHDHTDGLIAICQARDRELIVFQTPDQATRGNVSTRQGRAVLVDSGCARPETLTGGPPIFAVPGFSGLYAVAAAGHTPGSTVYLANMGGELWVFAGDISNFMQNLRENRAKSPVYRFLMGENSARQAELRGWLGELDRRPGMTVVVSHDLDAMEATMPAWSPASP